MHLYRKLGMYLFTLGAIIALLAGAFPLAEDAHNLALVSLVFLGVFSAILNITQEEEHPFLIAGSAFLLAILCFDALLGENPLVLALTNFFEVVVFFIGSMVATVALKLVVLYGHENEVRKPLEGVQETEEHAALLLITPREHAWNLTVFLAVAASFIVVLLDVFFSLNRYVLSLLILDLFVMVIFIVDLVVLYRREKDVVSFLKHCWLDILAAIPFWHFTRVLKIARLFKLFEFLKLSRTAKFFSDKSGVKGYLSSPETEDGPKAHGQRYFGKIQAANAKTTEKKRRT